MNPILGIDVGGTQVKVVAVTTAGEILGEHTVPTGDDGTSEWRVRLAGAADDLCVRLGMAPLVHGLAAPGLPARDGLAIAAMPGRLAGLEHFHWQTLLGATK